MPLDSGRGQSTKIKLTQFNSDEEYCEAMMKALELLDNFQPVPEPMRTKLILEAENFKKQGKSSCLV